MLDMSMVGVIAVVSLFGGFIAGMVGYTKNRTTATFVAFFIAGALLPVLGIVIAALSKGPDSPPGRHLATRSGPPAGWYNDPHGATMKRWWDGAVWTEHTAEQGTP
jgi:hypothetical protein